jgi:hypothetical protein
MSKPNTATAKATAKAAKVLAELEQNLKDAKNVKINTGNKTPHKPDAGNSGGSWWTR